MRVKHKFKSIWSKPVQIRGEDAQVHPFPGSSLLRWAILNARTGTLLYEGKPSTQALRAAAKVKNGCNILEFDKEAPFLAIKMVYDGAMYFNRADWTTWGKFHGGKIAIEYYKAIYGGKAGAGI